MKRFKIKMLIILSAVVILSGCGKVDSTYKPKESSELTKEQKVVEERMVIQIAKNYVKKTYGELTDNQHFDAKKEKDGTYTVQVYRDLGNYNEGIAWLNVNPKTKKVIDGVH
ncbi:hypothetical protein [Gottfriedia solisilvae]|uniref:Lipoprotein n=1 Tax=Gottfriedia solisilvae TaxID=1516104 RepID=A0A8J3AMN5_9BACI|nr:hypothetical protein [Gottfriedia solisilvae]GGI16439.1 hypothetical protein GCM10007380_32970 [Gottfriedia solisilvae]